RRKLPTARHAVSLVLACCHPSDRPRSQEVPMTKRGRVKLDNARELLEVVGINESEVETIVRFRAERGPIADGQQLSAVLGGRPMTAAILERADFSPSETTSPEAPGASEGNRSGR